MRLARFLLVALLLALGGTGFAQPSPASAAPANDSVFSPRVIPSSAVSYEHRVSTTSATRPSSDPGSCSKKASVWYAFTPAVSGGYTFYTGRSDYETNIGIFIGRPSTNSYALRCHPDDLVTGAMRAGRTYYILVTGVDGGGRLNLQMWSAGRSRADLSRMVDERAELTSKAYPGTRMGVGVYGFTTSHYFEIYFLRGSAKSFLDYDAPDAEGSGAGYFRVPSVPKGSYTIRVEQITAAQTIVATTRLAVIPRLRLSPTSGAPHATTTATLRGFAAREAIQIQWWDGDTWRVVTTTTTSASGSATAEVRVPGFATRGTNKIRAVGPTSRAAADPFTVTGAVAATAGDEALPETPTATASSASVPSTTATLEPIPDLTEPEPAAATVTATATATPELLATALPTETPVPNASPVADAAADQTRVDNDGTGDEPVQLTGSGSADPEGGTLVYRWSEGETVLSSEADPIVSLAVGTHVLTLTVTDDHGATAADEVVVTVDPASAVEIPKQDEARRVRSRGLLTAR